jgi:transposase
VNNPISIENWKPAPSKSAERARIARHEERRSRYDNVIALHQSGLTQLEIASRTGISERTVRYWLRWDAFPEEQRRRKQSSPFDTYAAYVLSRWEAGEHNGRTLFKEIQGQGYPGSEQMVNRFLIPLRGKQRIISKAAFPDAPLQDFSPKEAVWLFVRDLDKLAPDERKALMTVRKASQVADKTYELVQEFRHMLHHLEGQKLDEWIAKVNDSQIRELRSFALGLERDKAAVLAGLTMPLNNGLVEGLVNKVKLIKRMMFGRAGFPLLRKRVLNAL